MRFIACTILFFSVSISLNSIGQVELDELAFDKIRSSTFEGRDSIEIFSIPIYHLFGYSDELLDEMLILESENCTVEKFSKGWIYTATSVGEVDSVIVNQRYIDSIVYNEYKLFSRIEVSYHSYEMILLAHYYTMYDTKSGSDNSYRRIFSYSTLYPNKHYKNGGLHLKLMYKNGLLDGKQTFYNNDGTLDLEFDAVMGEIHGNYTDYRYGIIVAQGSVEHNEKIGKWRVIIRGTNSYQDVEFIPDGVPDNTSSFESIISPSEYPKSQEESQDASTEQN